MKTDFQRWTAKRKVELILRIIKGETSLADICREKDLKQSEVEGWIVPQSQGKRSKEQCPG